jgi:hypothetical protein
LLPKVLELMDKYIDSRHAVTEIHYFIFLTFLKITLFVLLPDLKDEVILKMMILLLRRKINF